MARPVFDTSNEGPGFVHYIPNPFRHPLIGMFFTGSLLIEVIFSLDGLGLLGFEAALNRDYPIVLGTLYVFTLLGLLLGMAVAAWGAYRLLKDVMRPPGGPR